MGRDQRTVLIKYPRAEQLNIFYSSFNIAHNQKRFETSTAPASHTPGTVEKGSGFPE